MLLVYFGAPGSAMSALAIPADISISDRRTAEDGSPGFISVGKTDTDYIIFGLAHARPLKELIPGPVIVNPVLGVRVRRDLAEAFRLELTKARFLDKDHAIIDEGDDVVIPVPAPPPTTLLDKYGAVVIDIDLPPRKHRADPIDEIRRTAEVPDSLRLHLPSKWERFGDVIVLRLDGQLERYDAELARAYAKVLGLKAVLKDVGGISGDHRRPVIKVLFGEDTVTTHIENGIRYRFDPAQIMFSSGNEEERIRMAGLSCTGETVVDMFAGIGYFSLPLAVFQKPLRIIACEINPVAHSYLVENIALNKVEGIVEPFLGDNRSLPGESFADRVIMGYVKTTHEFLPTAVRLVKDGGIIHYHETCPNELIPERSLKRLEDSVGGGGVTVLRIKEIKSYAPGVTHLVVDARIRKPA